MSILKFNFAFLTFKYKYIYFKITNLDFFPRLFLSISHEFSKITNTEPRILALHHSCSQRRTLTKPRTKNQ